MSKAHELLWSVCKKLPSDYEPYGQRSDSERGADCSCGCRHYVPLDGPLGMDWGVCANAKSPRAGLLTFEHQGCKEFQERKEYEFQHLQAENVALVKLHNELANENAALKEILETVAHNALRLRPDQHCGPDCPRCAYEKLKQHDA